MCIFTPLNVDDQNMHIHFKRMRHNSTMLIRKYLKCLEMRRGQHESEIRYELVCDQACPVFVHITLIIGT